MDGDGLQVDALAERLAGGLRPKLLYVIPEYQNPTGRTLPLAAAGATRRAVPPPRRADLEDVAYREIAFDDGRRRRCGRSRPMLSSRRARSRRSSRPASASAGRSARRDVLAQMAVAKQTTDQCSNGFGQRIVEAYGRSGGFERQLPRSRELYAAALARAGGRAAAAPAGRLLLDDAGRRVLRLADAAGVARRRRDPGRRHRGRRHVRAGRRVPRRRRRDERAPALVQLPSDDDLDRAVERLAGVIRSHL
jgi:2-aminoadipate transaminase